ncbi:MAG: helix-turn-helix domain-containing protein [Candidatus Dormibacteria bacterium]
MAEMMTVPQAAERLGIGKTYCWEMTARGQLPVIRLGRRVLIPADALADWIRSNTVGSEPADEDAATGSTPAAARRAGAITTRARKRGQRVRRVADPG